MKRLWILVSAVALAGTAGVLAAPHISPLAVMRKVSAVRDKGKGAVPPMPAQQRPGKAALPPAPRIIVHTTTVPVFSGTDVTAISDPVVPSILASGYPLSIDPLAFYSPGAYTLSFQLQGMLRGRAVVLQLFGGPGKVLAASSWGGQVEGAVLLPGAATLTNLSQDSAYFSVRRGASVTWYVYDLLSGSVQQMSGTPVGAEVTADIAGIPETFPDPVVVPGPSTAGAPLPSSLTAAGSPAQQCLAEANVLFRTHVPLSAVALTQNGAEVALSRLSPGRWLTVAFVSENGVYAPQTVTTEVDGLTLTYQIHLSQGGQAQSVVLSEAQIARLEKLAAQKPYTAQESQAGALGLMPRNFQGAATMHPGAPKILMTQGSQAILGLTYPVTAGAKTAFIPVGWYWWTHGPQVLPIPSSASSAPSSASPSAPLSGSGSPASS